MIRIRVGLIHSELLLSPTGACSGSSAITYCLNMDHALLHGDRWTIATSYIGSHLYEYDTTGVRLFRQPWNLPGAQSSKVNAMVLGADDALYLAGRAQLVGSAGDGFVAKLEPVSTRIAETDAPHMLLYPVPASDHLFLPPLASASVITSRDVQGTAVLTTPSRKTIDVAQFPAGLYFFEASGESQRRRFEE